MKDMKLKTLLPVGKIEPRQKVNEILGVETLPNNKGVELTIDDAVLHIYPGTNIQSIDALRQLVAALAANRWFTKMMYSANTKRQVDEIQMSLTADGVKFSSRR